MSEAKVPEGYKQTEVGVIPEDWEVSSINDYSVKVGSGKTPTGGSSVYVRSGRPFIRSQNVGWGKLKLDDVAYITEEIHNTFLGSQIEESDVLLNITGASIGRCSKADNRIAGGNVNQHVCLIRTDEKKLISKLLVNLINSNSGQKQIDSYQAGGNREGLNFSQVRQLKFAIPVIVEEQTAIATALSNVDDLIQSLEKLIAKKETIKTATMQQLLTGKTRLPEFATRENGSAKGFKQTELGRIPEDWEVSSLGELCKYQNGRTLEKYFNNYDGYRVISIGNYSKYGRYIDTGSFIDRSLKTEVGKFVLNQGDLAMILNDKTAIGTIIGRVILIDKNNEYVMNQRTMRLSPKDKVNSRYLHFLINSDFVHSRIKEMAKPGTQIYINTNDVLDFILYLPSSNDEKTAIATILSDMDAEIQALQHRLEKTQDIKQGMMQQLLAGKVRLAH